MFFQLHLIIINIKNCSLKYCANNKFPVGFACFFGNTISSIFCGIRWLGRGAQCLERLTFKFKRRDSKGVLVR